METYTIEKDITVVCLQASAFPDGINDAHTELHSMLTAPEQRIAYGISYSDGKGGIIYKAALSQLREGEATTYGLDTFVIRKGEYMSELLLNFREDMRRVDSTFQKLLALPELDPQGYCLELYLNDKDMRCMVPLKNNDRT